MAERGELDGKNLVEPSSGNTGIALGDCYLPKKLVVRIRPTKQEMVSEVSAAAATAPAQSKVAWPCLPIARPISAASCAH